jgi:hypothetical protein
LLPHFKPGDTVPVTGWYRISHPSHGETAEQVLEAGDAFASCPECALSPTYELIAAEPEKLKRARP